MTRRPGWRPRLAAAPAMVLLLLGPAFGDGPDTCQGKVVTLNGTSGDDELIGTGQNDVIAGGLGHDVIKGLEGDDTLCGGDGADGINGGPGADSVTGGGGDDTIMGHDGHDALEGGDGNDAIYGGAGGDKLYGGTFYDGTHTDSHLDFMTGNSDADTARTSSGDRWHEDTVSGTPTCVDDFARRMGAYRPDRLTPQSGGCVTVSGKVMLAGPNSDGDYSMNISAGGVLYHVEFMARDRYVFPQVAQDTYVTVSGLLARDQWHSGWIEVHPVFFLRLGGASTNCVSASCYYSGPQNGGSPYLMNPSGSGRRYCWRESGEPCAPYGGDAFH